MVSRVLVENFEILLMGLEFMNLINTFGMRHPEYFINLTVFLYVLFTNFIDQRRGTRKS